MEQKKKTGLYAALILLATFILWTVLLCTVEVKPIGPDGSAVGFATLNQSFATLTGTNFTLYTITDWLGLVPIGTAFGFFVLGLLQWIKRGRFSLVDRSIRLLGVFYVLVIAAYLLFERVVINYRPVLINGYLEVSYPSSTTLLVLCVMPTAIMQLWGRIKSDVIRYGAVVLILAFVAFTVIGRLLSGVHWLTDIIGGAMLGAALVTAYAWASFSK